jgi:hypothetical protein
MPENGAVYAPIDWQPLSAVAKRLGCSTRHLQREVTAGRLRAVPIDDRGTLRTCPQWADEWVVSRQKSTTIKKAVTSTTTEAA